MKKIIALVLTLSVFSMGTVFAQEPIVTSEDINLSADASEVSDDYYYAMFRPQNFTIPAGSAGWQIEDYKDGVNYLEGASGAAAKVLCGTVSNDTPAYITFYVPVSGTYYIWAMGRDFSENNPGGRLFYIAVDGEEDSHTYASHGIEGWSWEKGSPYTLDAGWHKLSVRGTMYMRTTALFVTNNADKVLDNDSSANYLTTLAPYEDITAPVFESANILSVSDTAVKLSWNCSDIGSGVGTYNIYINDSQEPNYSLSSEDNEITIENLAAGSTIDVRLEAKDLFGNNVSKVWNNYTVAPLQVSKFSIKDMTGSVVTDPDWFWGGDEAKVSVTVENSSSEEKSLLLGIAVYNKKTGRMVSGSRKSTVLEAGGKVSNFSTSITLPDDYNGSAYYIQATLWNNENSITPIAHGILLGNRGR